MKLTARNGFKRIGASIMALALSASLVPLASATLAPFVAEDLTLQPGTNESYINLNWYADEGTNDAKVKFTPTGSSGSILTADADESAAASGKVACKATIAGLVAGTEYNYSVSNDGGNTWSEEYTFTADDGDNTFSFAFVGDPQLKDKNQDANSAGVLSDGATLASNTAISKGWADTLAALDAKGVDFIASAGDQVDTTGGNEWEYTALYAPEQMQSIPFAAAVGNHDRHINFTYHYNLPNEQAVTNSSAAATAATSLTGNYFYSYNNALFVVLNDSDYPASTEQAAPYIAAFRATLEAATTEYSDYEWLIVQHHKSTESVAQHVADTDIQYYVEAGFEKLMDEFHVDFVLAGHDHVYARSYAMYNGQRVSEDTDALTDPAGTVYITCNTGSGLKYYGIFSNSLYVKDNTAYPYLANGLTGSQNYLAKVYPLSTDVAVQNYIPGYTIIDVNGSEISFTTYATYAQASDATNHPAGDVLDSFTVTKTASQEAKTQGVNNGSSTLNTELTARYDSEVVNEDGGSTEIVVYNSDNKCAYAVNGTTGHLVKIDMSGVTGSETSVAGMTGVHIPVKEIMQTKCPDFSYGDMTSVAVSTQAKVLAVAIQAESYDATGKIAFFTYDGQYIASYDTGVQPDMVTFTADGMTALTADEGEPRNGITGTGAGTGTDPKGSVTIVEYNATTPESSNVTTVNFDSFDSKRDDLVNAGVVLKKETAPSTDLEPEYIAVSGSTAYVSLQEANSIAVLDIAGKTFTGVYPLGLQDYGTTKIDLLKDDSINITNQANVYGIKMPDGISTYTANGKTYLLTANEGDSRSDWAGLDNESEGKTSPTGSVTTSEDVVWFNASLYDGLDQDKAYIFGGRSFSVYEVTSTGLSLVYDSGSDFETITAENFASNFNCSNDKIKMDNRSGKKGPEPETVTVGTVGSRSYAFITLERIGGIMVYDITDPANISYANYINSRDFSAKIAGDVSPEGLAFVSASQSATGKAMLLSANEVSGTVCAYTMSPVSAYIPPVDTKPSEPDAWVNPFTDVKENDWFYSAVQYANENGLMNGTASGSFSPATSTSRGMVATILYTLSKAEASGANPFDDVPAGQYYSDAVIWAAANGIVSGYGSGRFDPNGSITREQLATILFNFAKHMGYDVSARASLGSFSDSGKVSGYASEALQWAVSLGLVGGTDLGTLDPQGTATRAQVAAILQRFANSVA